MDRRKITILTFGTRGDVQPCLALALGLDAAGYDVTLGADLDFESDIRQRGIRYAPLKLNLRKFLNSAEGKAAMNGASGSRAKKRAGDSDALVFPMLDDCWAASQGADALIYDTMLTPAYLIAEKLGIPAIMTSVMPNMSPTKAFPLIGAPRIGLGEIGNRLSYEFYRLDWIRAHATLARWSLKTLHTKPRSRFTHYGYKNGRPVPVLYSYSPLLLPSPADWNSSTLASGYWLLEPEEEWQPPADLAAFVAGGPPPVYVGFGSMVGIDPAQLTQLVVAAVEKAGERALLDAGWGGITGAGLPESVFSVGRAPHHWLLPRVKAMVHHGGAGTVAAALRFAKPSVICPFVTDQFLWGDVVWRRGFSSRPIPQRELTADLLAAAIRQTVADEAMRGRLEAFSQELRREDGVSRAVQFVSEHIGPPAR